MSKARLIIRHEVSSFFKDRANLFYFLIFVLLGFLSNHIIIRPPVKGNELPQHLPRIIIYRYAFYVILSFFAVHLASQTTASLRREWDSKNIYYSLLAVKKRPYYFFSNLAGQILTHLLFVFVGCFTLILIYLPTGMVYGNFLATPLLLLPFVCFMVLFVNYLYYGGVEKNAGLATLILYLGFLGFSIRRFKYLTLILPDVYGIQKSVVNFAFDSQINVGAILAANYQVIVYASLLALLLYRQVNKMEIAI